jgi:hypothetical protein
MKDSCLSLSALEPFSFSAFQHSSLSAFEPLGLSALEPDRRYILSRAVKHAAAHLTISRHLVYLGPFSISAFELA